MKKEFLRQTAKSMALHGALLSAFGFGGLYFGFYLRWMFFVMCVFGVVESWGVSAQNRLSSNTARIAQYLGFVVAAAPFGIVIFNLFGIVGMTQIAIVSASVLGLSLLLWIVSLLLPEH